MRRLGLGVAICLWPLVLLVATSAPSLAQWRAMAVCGNGICVGWGYAATRAEAERKAYWNCTLNGTDCRVVMRFNRGCGARAYDGRGGWGTGYGCSKLEAEANAMISCRKAGNRGCRSPWAHCTTKCSN